METLLISIALWVLAQEMLPVPPSAAPQQEEVVESVTPPAQENPVQAAPPPPAPDALMVLPVETGSLGPAVSTMITHAVTLQAGEVFQKVLGQGEVEELLRHETVRMLAGCSDDSCVAELAQATGVRFVLLCRVQSLDTQYFWNCSLLDQAAGQVVRRQTLRASSLRELHAQAGPMVRFLAGRPTEGALTVTSATQNVGLRNRDHARALVTFARQHKDLSTQEAVTAFILQRNQESRLLAWAQAAAFVAAGALLVPGPALVLLAVLANGVSQHLVLGLAGAAAVLACLSLTALSSGVTLAGVDALDLGEVTVPQDGCCRDDAELLDEEQDVRSLQAAALLTALAGPVAVAAAAGTCFLGVEFGGFLRAPSGVAAAPYVVAAASSLAFACGTLLTFAACGLVPLVSLVTGGLLLMRPQEPLVGPPRRRPAREKRP